jgi:hypothetical protein
MMQGGSTRKMRLSMAVNGSNAVVASIEGPGYLSAHLNLTDRPKDKQHQQTVKIAGTMTGATETVHLKWPGVELEVGDVVELRVLPEGRGDEPSESRKSSESPYNLFSRPELAKELLQAVSQFEERLHAIADKSKELEPADENQKFNRAWGSVVWELGRNLLYPIYRRHPELIPEEMKNEIL